MANDQHPLLGALGLCRKAGKLLHGYDRVQENSPAAVRWRWSCLPQTPAKRTVTHMRSACEGIVACEQMPLTTADLGDASPPKPAAVFGITDEHLAQLCAKTSYLMQRRTQFMDFKYKIADVAKEFGVPAKKVIETVSAVTGDAYKTAEPSGRRS